jgi:hypothetical protein
MRSTWRRDLAAAGRRIRARREPVGAGPAAIVAAALLGLAYYSIKAAAWRTARPCSSPAAYPAPAGR